MEDLAKTAFEKFESLLRTFIPGSIFMTALLLAGEQSTIAKLLGDSEAKWAFAALLVGVVLYGVHYAVLEDLFTEWTVRWVRRKSPNLVPNAKANATDSEILVWMSRERWARPVATDVRAQSHQRHLAKQYDWLIFLYCTAYALTASSLAVLFWQSTLWSGIMLLAVGLFFFGSAIRADMSITRKELWLNVTFPQH